MWPLCQLPQLIWSCMREIKGRFNYHPSCVPLFVTSVLYACLPPTAAYKYADGKKIDSKRVVVDVERGRTVKSWKPRRLGTVCVCVYVFVGGWVGVCVCVGGCTCVWRVHGVYVFCESEEYCIQWLSISYQQPLLLTTVLFPPMNYMFFSVPPTNYASLSLPPTTPLCPSHQPLLSAPPTNHSSLSLPPTTPLCPSHQPLLSAPLTNHSSLSFMQEEVWVGRGEEHPVRTSNTPGEWMNGKIPWQ